MCPPKYGDRMTTAWPYSTASPSSALYADSSPAWGACRDDHKQHDRRQVGCEWSASASGKVWCIQQMTRNDTNAHHRRVLLPIAYKAPWPAPEEPAKHKLGQVYEVVQHISNQNALLISRAP